MTTLALIFFAELGDKTQLTTMMLAAQSRQPVAVFAGAAVALVMTSLLGVAFGETITRLIPMAYIRGGAGAAFIILGVLLIAGRL
ncbi:MAG: TMEM165/GDT1 family protein [Bacillota bacterium]